MKKTKLAILVASSIILVGGGVAQAAALNIEYAPNKEVTAPITSGDINYVTVKNGDSLSYSGQNKDSDSLSFSTTTEKVNSFFKFSWGNGKVDISNLKELNFLTPTTPLTETADPETDPTKKVEDADAVVMGGGTFTATKIHNVNFGSTAKDQRIKAKQIFNTYGSSKVNFEDIDNLSFYSDANQTLHVQSSSTFTVKNVTNLIIDNHKQTLLDEQVPGDAVWNAIQILTMGSNTSSDEYAKVLDISGVENLVIKSKNDFGRSAGILIKDLVDGAAWKGSKSIQGDISAKNIDIDGGTFGVISNREYSTSTPAGKSVLNITGENYLKISGSTASINVDNKQGAGDSIALKGDSVVLNGAVTLSGNEKLEENNGNKLDITANDLTVNGVAGIAVNSDKYGAISLASKGGNVATTKISGDVKVDGALSLEKQNIQQSTGTFKVGTLGSTDSTLVFNTFEKGGVSIGKFENNKNDLKLVAGGEVTDHFASGKTALEKIKSEIIASDDATVKETLQNSITGGEGGDMIRGWTVETDADGNETIKYDGGQMYSDSIIAIKNFNAATLSQWRYEVNHLSDRLGDVRNTRSAIGSWARIYGADTKVSDTVSTKVKLNSIQVGTDAAVGQNWIVGGAFGYTKADAEFTNGTASNDTYSLAVYGTAYFDCGGYIDLIGRIGRLSSDVDVTSATQFKGSYDNTAFGLSAEVGYQWNLSKTFYVTPQAQLSYGYVKGDDYTSSNNIHISQDNFQTLVGRLGTQAGANFAEGKGKVYLTASLNHDFQGDTEATARSGETGQPLSFKEDLGTTWFSYGVGFQYDTDKNFNIYGSLTKANGNDYQDDYRYSVGVRYNW